MLMSTELSKLVAQSNCYIKIRVLIRIPGDATSRVKPLDVVINKPFKNYVREVFEKHIDENLEAYVEGVVANR